jgi:hypothetical protein
VLKTLLQKIFGAGRNSAGAALASVLWQHSTEGRTSVENWIGSAIEGSSFSGLLTRVEIGHKRIGSAGKAASSHAGAIAAKSTANELRAAASAAGREGRGN